MFEKKYNIPAGIHVVEPNAMHPESGMAGVSHDKSKEGRIHHRRLKEFYERHQNTYGIEPTLIAFASAKVASEESTAIKAPC